jgi:hypothetical protein
MFGKIKRWFKKIYRSLVTQDATPQEIAWGASVGVFLGVFPTFGLGIPVSIGLAYLFGFNRASAIVGSTIMNPITTPFFWAVSALLGKFLTGVDISGMVDKWRSREIFSLGRETVVAYLLGNLVLSVGISVIIWIIIYFGANKYRELKQRREERGSIE